MPPLQASVRPAECGRCGRAFGCGAAEARCWCAEIEVPAATLRRIADAHRGCLCPACLEDIAPLGWRA